MTETIKIKSEKPVDLLWDKVKELVKGSISVNSRKAIESDARQYLQFDPEGFPTDERRLSEFVAAMCDVKKVSTILRYISSISKIHQMSGWPDPTKTPLIRTVLSGLRKQHGQPAQKARAIRPKDLKKILASLNSTSWIDSRNKTLFCLGWAGALRCSELAAMRISDILKEDNGLLVRIRRSKTDKEGHGAHLGLPTSDFTNIITAWVVRLSNLYRGDDGPLFPRLGITEKWFPGYGLKRPLTKRGISSIVKTCARQAGFKESDFSPHSLRSGLITTAAEVGVPERIIARHSRHVSMSVLRGYIESGTVWLDNPLSPIFDRFFRGQ
jgi:integrase